MMKDHAKTPVFILAVLAALAGVAAASGSQGASPATQALQSEIQAVTHEIHPTDTADWWRNLGPQAPAVIMSMYQETSSVYERLRLIEGLGWFDDQATTDFLKQQAQDATDDVIRDASITSIAISQGAQAEDFISGFLQSDDPQTRYSAASALKRIGDARSNELLTGYLSTEKLAWLRNRIIQQPVNPPVAPLRIATRQERKLNAAFDGHWTGFWVEPVRGPKASAGMKSDPVALDLTLRNGTDLSGELQRSGSIPPVSGVASPKSYRLDRIVGKEGRITGVFSRKLASSPGKPSRRQEVAFDGELVQKDGITVLHFVMPEALGTMIVRREAAK